MKNLYVFILTFTMILFAAYSLSSYDNILLNKKTQIMETTEKTIFDFEVKSLDGKTIDFNDFKGKKILIVNTASECGFTPQYEGLQELHEKMGDKVAIIGFPANNFGGQEPGTDDEIKSFCQKNYGVSFTMASKVSVKGDDQHELFEWLCQEDNESFKGAIKWNFEKFLLNEEGVLTHRFRSDVKPMSEEITSKL